MRIGMVTDSLAHLPLDGLLRTAAELGVEMLEFPCGNWSPAPHLNLDASFQVHLMPLSKPRTICSPSASKIGRS